MKDALLEEDNAIPSMDWKGPTGDAHQNRIAQCSADTFPDLERDAGINKKSLRPLAVGQQYFYDYNYEAFNKADCCLGSISQRSLQDVRGRLALACHDTEAPPLQRMKQWRQWRSKRSKAKTDQTASTPSLNGSDPYTRIKTKTTSERTMSATLLNFLRGDFGLHPHLHINQQQQQRKIYKPTHTGDEQHYTAFLSAYLLTQLEAPIVTPLSPPEHKDNKEHNNNTSVLAKRT